MFPIVPVDPALAESLEPLGTKRKFWFSDDQGQRRLFKAEERGTGEDWAEKIACELAGLLGLPHVHYELAPEVGTSVPGVVCNNCCPPPRMLVLGNELLLERDPCYPAGKRFKVREHTVAAVAEVIERLDLPPQEFTGNLPEGITTALEVFAGYVMFDAWIANQDRHHENWAAIREGETLRLAPTYDHGASLARNLKDEERSERLTTRDVNRQLATFVQKARSAFYGTPTDTKPLSTMEAWQAFAARVPDARTTWLVQLRRVCDTDVDQLIAQVPEQRMSPLCRVFTRRLLQENQRRLLEESDS
jgi:hypothetical protein